MCERESDPEWIRTRTAAMKPTGVRDVHLRLDQHALRRDGGGAFSMGVDWSLVRHWGGGEHQQLIKQQSGVPEPVKDHLNLRTTTDGDLLPPAGEEQGVQQ